MPMEKKAPRKFMRFIVFKWAAILASRSFFQKGFWRSFVGRQNRFQTQVHTQSRQQYHMLYIWRSFSRRMIEAFHAVFSFFKVRVGEWNRKVMLLHQYKSKYTYGLKVVAGTSTQFVNGIFLETNTFA